jgi:hypothetical protein
MPMTSFLLHWQICRRNRPIIQDKARKNKMDYSRLSEKGDMMIQLVIQVDHAGDGVVLLNNYATIPNLEINRKESFLTAQLIKQTILSTAHSSPSFSKPLPEKVNTCLLRQDEEHSIIQPNSGTVILSKNATVELLTDKRKIA